MLSSEQEATPARGLRAGYPPSVGGGDGGSERGACLALGTASVWHVSSAPAVPVRPAASWGWSSVPFTARFPGATRTTAS